MKTKSLILMVLFTFFQMNLGLNSAYSQSKGKDKPRVSVTAEQGVEVVPGADQPPPPETNVVPEPQSNTEEPTPPVRPVPQPQPQPQNGKNTLQVPNRGGSVQPVLPNTNGKTQLLPGAGSGSAQPVNTGGKTELVPSSRRGSVAPVEPGTVEASGNVVSPEQPPEASSAPVYVPTSNPTKDPCEDKAMAEIYKLLMADNHNVLGIMFELTAMRLAKRTLEQEPTYSTFEDLTVTNIKALTDQVDKLDKDKVIQDKVRKVYEVYGKKDDDKKVEERLKDLQKDARAAADRASNACYFDKETRFRNDESSAFIMATVIGEGGDLSASTKDNPAKLTDIDAATVWVVERARKEAEDRLPHDKNGYQIGSKNGNMLNVSTRVTRYLGRIADGRQKLTPAMMDELIKKEQDQLKELVNTIYQDTKEGAKNHIRDELKACITAEVAKSNENCKDCAVQKRMTALETVNLDIDNIQRGLLQSVSKAENLKIENGLQAKLGPVYVDFNSVLNSSAKGGVQVGESGQDLGHDFADAKNAAPGEGTVPRLPPRGTKENCKKFWAKKAGMKHGKVAKTKPVPPAETNPPESSQQPAPEQKVEAKPADANGKPADTAKPVVSAQAGTNNPPPASAPLQANPKLKKPSPIRVKQAPEPQTVVQTDQTKPAAAPVPPAPVPLVNAPGEAPADAYVPKPGDSAEVTAEKIRQAMAEQKLAEDRRKSAEAAKQGGNPRAQSERKPARKVAASNGINPEVQKSIAAITASPDTPYDFGRCKLTYSKDKKTLTVLKNGKPYGKPVDLSGQNSLETEMPALAESENCAFNTNR